MSSACRWNCSKGCSKLCHTREVDQWNADQYLKFQQERSQPAYDLMDFIGPRRDMRIVDLGCGTGEHTRTLHERFQAVETLGIDTSEGMLAKAPRLLGLKFYKSDIQEFGGDSEFDLIFSNAALHWVPDHEKLLARFRKAIRPGGQIAIQVPKNGDHPSQRIAYTLEKLAPYNSFPPNPLERNTLAPEEYAALLTRLGFRSVKVRLYVYVHQLPDSDAAVEWMKGSLLTCYKANMPAPTYQSFEDEFRRRVVAELGPDRPYLYTFKRILMHAVR